MRASAVRFAKNESGATSIEYALIATIVCIGLVASLVAIRDGLTDRFNNVSTVLSR